jgi:hypothetical protein
MPVIGFLGSESLDLFAGRLRAFRRGLNEMGFVEGRNYSSNTTGRRVNMTPAGFGSRPRSPAGDRSCCDNNAIRTGGQGGDHDDSDRFPDRQRPRGSRICRHPQPAGRQYDRRFLGGEAEPSRAVSARLTVIARRTVTCCQTTNAGSC